LTTIILVEFVVVIAIVATVVDDVVVVVYLFMTSKLNKQIHWAFKTCQKRFPDNG